MSTFSTNQADGEHRVFKQELQSLQEIIVRQRNELVALATKLHELHMQPVLTKNEAFEKERAIAFKERQLHGARSTLNRIEARARTLARMFES